MNDVDTFGWGLVGPGRIAHKFADALRGVEGARLVAVQGRDAQRAQDFAARWGAASAGIDLDVLLADPAVHGVYIATPNAFLKTTAPSCTTATATPGMRRDCIVRSTNESIAVRCDELRTAARSRACAVSPLALATVVQRAIASARCVLSVGLSMESLFGAVSDVTARPLATFGRNVASSGRCCARFPTAHPSRACVRRRDGVG